MAWPDLQGSLALEARLQVQGEAPAGLEDDPGDQEGPQVEADQREEDLQFPAYLGGPGLQGGLAAVVGGPAEEVAPLGLACGGPAGAAPKEQW